MGLCSPVRYWFGTGAVNFLEAYPTGLPVRRWNVRLPATMRFEVNAVTVKTVTAFIFGSSVTSAIRSPMATSTTRSYTKCGVDHAGLPHKM